MRFAPWAGLGPRVKYFTDRSRVVLLLWIFYVFSILCLLCLYARLFVYALWSPAGKGQTSWLSFVVSYCDFLMILFLPIFMPNVTTLILKLSISHFYMVMFLVLHPMESISLNSFVLLEHLAMLLTSTLAINC